MRRFAHALGPAIAAVALAVGPGAHAAPDRGAVERAAATPAIDAVAVDAAPMPDGDAPPVVAMGAAGGKTTRTAAASIGWSAALMLPPLRDPRRRMPSTTRPKAFGATLAVGERFRYDVSFGGNNAGQAEAEIVGLENDPRGGPPHGAPILRIEGHARTSGIVSLLATITDDMTTLVDASTGATVWSENVLVYSGLSPAGYKKRVTTADYEGRGQVRIVDVKDGKPRKHLKHAPLDTFDPLGVMAWVRAQPLAPGDRAKAHVIDGTTLMRIEVEVMPPSPMERMPSVGKALGLGKNDAVKITGTMTRVDAFDQPLPGKRVFTMRAWLSADARKIPLAMESDMWVGAVRLELSSYDPPRADRSSAEGPRAPAP